MASIISVPKFAELKTGPERFQLIDVRPPSEYATGHIPGAVNMPWIKYSPPWEACWA
jgi:rhodanese-related sulfurtransferase